MDLVDRRGAPIASMRVEGGWTTEPFGEGQVFDPDGARRGPQFSFAEAEVNGPANAVSATRDGEFVVVLTDLMGAGYELRARRVGANGELTAPSFAVSPPAVGSIGGQMFDAIATDADDSFLVAWYDETKAQMRGRHFARDQPTRASDSRRQQFSCR